MNRCGTSLQGTSTAQFALVSASRLRPALFDSVEIAVAECSSKSWPYMTVRLNAIIGKES